MFRLRAVRPRYAGTVLGGDPGLPPALGLAPMPAPPAPAAEPPTVATTTERDPDPRRLPAGAGPLFSLAYVSSAITAFGRAELLALLEGCRERNARAAITGMLLYKEGNFMQVIEGPEAAVRALHAKIGRDGRHRGVITLLQSPIEARQFAGWSMAFRDLDDPAVRGAREQALRALPGYSEFLNVALSGQEFAGWPSRCQKLLLTFKRQRP